MEAVRFKVVPAHNGLLLPAVGGAGTGFTVIVVVAVPVQPELVPATVYVMVMVGFAVTVEPVVALNPAAGAQEYVVAPPAVNSCESPSQIVAVAGVTVTIGEGLTLMASVRGALVPHALLDDTETFPEVFPTVTVIELVDPPDVITDPAGTDHE